MTFTDYWLVALAICFISSMGQMVLIEFNWFENLLFYNRTLKMVLTQALIVSAIVGLTLAIFTPMIILLRI